MNEWIDGSKDRRISGWIDDSMDQKIEESIKG